MVEGNISLKKKKKEKRTKKRGRQRKYLCSYNANLTLKKTPKLISLTYLVYYLGHEHGSQFFLADYKVFVR